jgi:hypothetical protein
MGKGTSEKKYYTNRRTRKETGKGKRRFGENSFE